VPKSRSRPKNRKNRKKQHGKTLSTREASLQSFGFPPDFSFVEQGPFFEGIPRETLDIALIERSENARIDLTATIDALDRVLLSVPPLQALADFAIYGLMARPGHDPEVDSPDPILQFHVELLQAFALRHELQEFATAPMLPDQFEELHRLIREAADNFTLRTFADSIAARGDPQKATQISIRDEIRIDTMAIRNWGYAPQVRRIVRDLLGPLESTIEQTIGLRTTLLFDAFHTLAERRADEIYDHRVNLQPIRKTKTLADALKVYRDVGIGPHFELAQLEEGQRRQRLKLRDVQMFLMVQVTNAASASFYTFNLEEIAAAYAAPVDRDLLRNALDRISLVFGDLKATDPEHLFMGNPVWRRPLVRLGQDTYFYPVAGMMLSFPLEITEALLQDSATLIGKYEKRRSVFLEQETARLLTAAFPNDHVFTNSQWRDPNSQVLYENDALVVVGRHVLVLEAKSGQVRAAARRGAPSLREDLTGLLVDAATQATRFARFLEAHPGEHAFPRRDGGANHVRIPRNAKVITLSVTLDELGGLAARWRDLQAAGIAPTSIAAVPSMSVTAIETVFALLPSSSQKLHYLQRRQEFEEHAQYHGDEFDLLAFYLYTGFNIGEMEFSGERGLFLTGISKILDPYLTQEHFGITDVQPVRQRLSPWWRDIIAHIERRRNDGWSRIGTTLLNVSYEDQLAFESKFRVVRNIVKRRIQVVPGTMDRVVIANGPPQRRDAIVALAYKGLTREQRDRRLLAAGADGVEASGAQFAWVLAVDVDAPHYPYTASLIVGEKEALRQLL
jgi:hypothetical protein